MLKEYLETLQPQLKISVETVAQQLVKVQADSEIASIQREQVMQDEATAIEQATVATAIKEECDAKLAEALPQMESALKALQTLTSADIAVVRSMRTPPLAVKVVLEGVCILKSIGPERVPGPSGVGYVEEYWPAAKKMMGDLKFLDSLINFEKDIIPPKNIQKLQERILTNENFDPEVVKLASTACEGLCNWIIAIYRYDKVYKAIVPKKLALEEAQASYNVRILI